MEKLVANVVRTTAFCLSNNTTKTRIHFFPVAANTTGSQPILCKLTLFGKGIEKKSVALDGGRLGQPDGLRLEDAFPALRGDVAGLFGIDIELSTSHERVNLGASQCVIEIHSPGFTVSYHAAPFSSVAVEVPDGYTVPSELVVGPRKRSRSLAGIQDAEVATSLVVVNGLAEPLRPAAFRSSSEGATALQVGTLTPESVVEVALDEALFRDSPSQELSWGTVKAGGIHFGELPPRGVGYYVLYRDPATKKPLSVCAL